MPQTPLATARHLASPAMQALRDRAPIWVGVAYWDPQVVPIERVREDFRRMHALGLTMVRLHIVGPDFAAPDENTAFAQADAWIGAALESGLEVIAHMPAAHADAAELARQGLCKEDIRRLGVQHPGVRAAFKAGMDRIMNRYRDAPGVIGWSVGGGEMGPAKLQLQDDLDKAHFKAWLIEHYGEVESVYQAWALYPRPYLPGEGDRFVLKSLDEAVRLVAAISFTEAGVKPLNALGLSHKVYGPARDLVRFRADQVLERTAAIIEIAREVDPTRNLRIGSHQLMYNHPRLGWDIQRLAGLADGHPTSIHLSWHFEAVDGEVDLPVYLQSRMTADFNKPGFGSAFETTCGPVQYSGGYGNHMDVGLMRRLMVCYLAAGNPMIAFWCWRARPGGWEAGEYGLLSLSDRETPWAHEVGAITRAMQAHAHDLWNSDDEAQLGILRSWDTEMILTLEPQGHALQDGPTLWSRGTPLQHLRAVIGAGRAASNSHLPFHYLGEQEILDGLVGAYPVLYAPHLRACSTELIEHLQAYVEAGGHLVLDVQFAFMDPWGKLHPRGEGTAIERLCGCWIDNIHHARTRIDGPRLAGMDVTGFYGDLVCTRATVTQRFADGAPAVASAACGAGRVTTIACDPARACHRPGNAAQKAWLAGILRGGRAPGWTADAPLVFRRRGERGDHWYIVNGSAERRVSITVIDRTYTAVQAVVGGSDVRRDGTTIALTVETGGAAWIYASRQD